MNRCRVLVPILSLFFVAEASRALELDQSPALPGEWGYRPAPEEVLQLTPPGFSWRPMKDIAQWEIQVADTEDFSNPHYQAAQIRYNVHCPPTPFEPGRYFWRYRGLDSNDNPTSWSQSRIFTIAPDATEMPLPAREDLLSRIPSSHPRLFVRPEMMDALRTKARGELKDQFERMKVRAEDLLADPPSTEEPPLYPEGIVRHGEEWRKIWWSNRVRVRETLGGAAELAFTRLLDGGEEYGRLAKRLLLEAAQWDPRGSTGYLYNDEAGMPYSYYFSRSYTFLHDLLTEEERELCRQVMKIRGDEMYNKLYPKHFWQPYDSHANRAWHFLGEISIAFQGEIEGAEEWAWFAMNVFRNVYPVWSDSSGGWHEGAAYLASYQSRFTWWADIMKAAFNIDAYDKPYYSQAGFFLLYLMPPGMVGGGFGDNSQLRGAGDNREIMPIFAAQAGNPYWQWYADQLDGTEFGADYIGFLRTSLPTVQPLPPTDLPSSRQFQGIGQAFLNSSLVTANENVQVLIKSSPFGTQSHGYDANNSFLLSAFGERMLVNSGRRDMHGSEHHSGWMWSTRSGNNITINGGEGQIKNSARARGRLAAFETTPELDVVTGDASESHPGLDRFLRTIIFVKPELVVVFDRLTANQPATFDYWLHAINEIQVTDQHRLLVSAGDSRCDINILTPQGLTFTQTNQYDPNPRERIRLREWHLTASTPEEFQHIEFVTLYRPRRSTTVPPREAELTPVEGGYVLTVRLSDGELAALLPVAPGASLQGAGLAATGEIIAERRDAEGRPIRTLRSQP